MANPKRQPAPVGELSKRVGERIARLRTARGFSLREVASATGLAPSQISFAELGQRKINLNMLEILANFFDVPPRALLPGTDELDEHLVPKMDQDQMILMQALKLDDIETLMQAVGVVLQRKFDRDHK